MSDYEFEDDLANGPKALRDHVKQLEKQLAEANKAKEALESQVTDLSAQVKKSSLTDLLKQAGVDPKFAARADRDGAEPTPEGVKAWIDENRDFYNFGEPKQADAETADDNAEPTIPDGVEEGVRAGQALDASGVAPSEVTVMSKLQAIDPSKFSSREELEAAIQAAGLSFA